MAGARPRRSWTRTHTCSLVDDAMMTLVWDPWATGTATAGVTNFVASEFEGPFAPGTPAAIMIGYATCADALGDVSRPAPTAIIHPSHAHPITFRYFAK